MIKSFDKTQDLRAVIFDLDGLLIDSETVAWPKALSDFLSARGVSLTDDALKKVRGLGSKGVIEVFKNDLGLKGDVDILIAEMRGYFFKIFLRNPTLTEGSKNILESLRKENYILAISTGLGPREKVMDLLSELDLEQYFEEVITGDEVVRGKPNPEIYLMTALKLNVKPTNCLVLEDSANGTLAGKAAGMTVYGVNKDEIMKESLSKAGADKVFSSLLEIKDL